MSKDAVFRSLVVSLSCCEWTAFAIEAHLKSRFPRKFHRYTPEIAEKLILQFPRPYAPSGKALLRYLGSLEELRKIAAHAKTHGMQLRPALSSPRFAPIPAFEGLDIPHLTTLTELADHLALTADQLTRFADLRGLSNATDNAFAPHYRFHLISKQSGGTRVIEEPKPILKSLQRRILQRILNKVPAHPAAFGLVAGRSCIQAAAKHAGEAAVIGFDLRDFFPSIAFSRIYGLFRMLGYPDNVARHFCGLCTLITPPHIKAPHIFRHRHLPQGAPTSPALANLVCHALDCRLSGLARSLGAGYIRYADDLTFSGDRYIIRALLAAVPDIVKNEGFALNADKTRVQVARGRQMTTGIVVNEKINVPRPHYDHLKAVIHHLKRPDDPRRTDQGFLRKLDGQIAWVEQINPQKGQNLRHRFDMLFQP